MSEMFDFLDGNLNGPPEAAFEDSRHWLDADFPFKGYAREEEDCGADLLEKPGMNGCGVATTERPTEE